VRVADNLSSRVKLLRGSEVVLLCVDKVTSFKVGNRHLDGERGVLGNGIAVLRVLEGARGHKICGRDRTHGRRIARTGCDLLSIGDGKIGYRLAVIDEVVRGGQGSDLTSFWDILAIVCESRSNNGGVKSQRCLSVTIIAAGGASACGCFGGSRSSGGSNSRAAAGIALALVVIVVLAALALCVVVGVIDVLAVLVGVSSVPSTGSLTEMAVVVSEAPPIATKEAVLLEILARSRNRESERDGGEKGKALHGEK